MSGSFATGSFPVAAQPYSNTCYAFFSDPAFRNRSTPYALYGASGGLCTLSQTGWTFFTTVAELSDLRDPTSRQVTFPQQGAPTLIMDGAIEATNLSMIEGAGKDFQKALFSLIDKVALSQTAMTDTTVKMDAELTADATIGQYYLKGSLKLFKDQQTGSYYDSNNTPQSYTTWGNVAFTMNVPVGSTTTPLVFHIIMADATWRSDYPYSEIIQVLPPIPWADLLTVDLSQMTSTTLAATATLMTQAVNLFSPAMETQALTDGAVYNFSAIGPSKAWTETVPFAIMYKGQVPSVQQVRSALQRAMANSNAGSQAQWQQRFPGVFATGRCYIVPMWDMVVPLTGRQIYRGILDLSTMQQKAIAVFPGFSSTMIQTEGLEITSPYDLIPCLSFRDPQNDPSAGIGTLAAQHPTYQCVKMDNYAFSLMDPNTQLFSAGLIDALSILSGQTPSNAALYQTVTEMGIKSVIFVVNSIEYAVISPDTYNAAQTEYQG